MFHRRIIKGFSLISVLIGLFILAGGIITLIRVYPVILNLSERSKNTVNLTFVAEEIFKKIEDDYSDKNIQLPEKIEGFLKEYPDYKYLVEFKEEKKDLYRVKLEIIYKREGKDEKKYFESVLRRR